ncbi:MAG: hypothetical protein WC724_03835 [Candidatus Paceibacterota bacterium]|jgi:hypothetical protein
MPPKTNQQVIDEATKVAQNASNISGVSGGAYKPQAISSEQLAPASPVNFGTYNPPTPPVLQPTTSATDAIDAQLKASTELGSSENSVQKMFDQYMTGLGTQQEADKYRIQQENQAGYTTANNQIRQYQDEYNAIVREQTALPYAMQEDIKNRPGVSVKGAVSVEEMGRNREIISRGLIKQSQLEVARGNLAQAKETADRSVLVKYGDITKQLEYQKNALDMIVKSPEYTKSQQDRAMQQSLLLEDRKTAVQNKIDDDKSIMALALSAQKNNPNDPAVGIAVNQAIASGDLKKAFALLGKYQDNPMELAQKILDQDLTRQQIKTSKATEAKTYAEMDSAKNGGNEILSVAEATALNLPYGTTKQQAISLGKTPMKPATAAQETTALYANRLEQSNAIISKLDDYVMNANPISYSLQTKLPNVANTLKSGNFQSVDQAQRNFINAVLRRESGAVISPAEFENGKQQYFAQPGDKPEVVAQKKANRDMVQSGFINGAGSAYTPMVDTMSGVKQTGTLPNGTVVTEYADGTIKDAKGNKYDKNGNKI